MKVLVGVPARDTVMTGFAHSLAVMVARTSASTDIEIRLSFAPGTLICDQRRQLAHEAIRCGADYLLFVDSDMRFPSDALTRLLAHKQPIVACNYTARRAPAEPVAFNSLVEGEKLWTLGESTGLEECAAVGMGFFLIHTDVLKATEKPWFLIPYIAAADGHWGEDVWFCNQARKAGFPTLIDHDLSKEVKHIGLREYDYHDAEEMREFVQAEWEAGRDRKQRMEAAE